MTETQEKKIPEAQSRVTTHETWQDTYRLSKQQSCWHNGENRITRFVVSSKATMVRAIFAECIVSPQSDHNYPKVKCLTASFKVKASIFLHRPAAYVWNTVIIDLLGSSDDRLLLCFMGVTYRSLFKRDILVDSFSEQIRAFSVDSGTNTAT